VRNRKPSYTDTENRIYHEYEDKFEAILNKYNVPYTRSYPVIINTPTGIYDSNKSFFTTGVIIEKEILFLNFIFQLTKNRSVFKTGMTGKIGWGYKDYVYRNFLVGNFTLNETLEKGTNFKQLSSLLSYQAAIFKAEEDSKKIKPKKNQNYKRPQPTMIALEPSLEYQRQSFKKMKFLTNGNSPIVLELKNYTYLTLNELVESIFNHPLRDRNPELDYALKDYITSITELNNNETY
jgi:hypothetical protein